MKDFHSIERRDILFSALIFFCGLMLYIRTLAPGLLLGDSAEFQTLAYTLGMTHPTGYPVYIILAHWFTLLPIGEMAWRVNLFSAFWGALAIACLYLVIRIISGWRLAALAGAFILGTTPLFWYHSVVAELYAPACAFITIILLLVVLWRQTNKPGHIVVASMIGALGLGVHSSVALCSLGIPVYLGLTKCSRQTWFQIFAGGIAGICILFAAYLFLDANNSATSYYNVTIKNALSLWQMKATDFDSPFERLKFLTSTRQFSSQIFPDHELFIGRNFQVYSQIIARGFPLITIILITVGVLYLFYFRWQEALLFTVGWGIQTTFALNYQVSDFVVFFVPGFIFLGLWAGIGLGALMQSGKRMRGYFRNSQWHGHCISIGLIVSILLANMNRQMLTTAWELENVSFMQGSGFDTFIYPIDTPGLPHQRATELVNSVEKNAIVFTDWNRVYAFYFVAFVEKDLRGLNFHQAITDVANTNRKAASTVAYILDNFRQRPIYFTEKPSGPIARPFLIEPVKKGNLTLFQVVGLR